MWSKIEEVSMAIHGENSEKDTASSEKLVSAQEGTEPGDRKDKNSMLAWNTFKIRKVWRVVAVALATEQKREIYYTPYQQSIPKSKWQHKNTIKITLGLRTDFRNDSNKTGVVKTVYGIAIFLLNHTVKSTVRRICIYEYLFGCLWRS